MIIDDEEKELDINKDNLINNLSEGPSITIEEDGDCMEIDLDMPKVPKKLEFLEKKRSSMLLMKFICWFARSDSFNQD